MARSHPLLAALRREMKAVADPERAAQQQAYMKSAMPYWGLSSADTRRVARLVFEGYDPRAAPDRWISDVLAIWRGATRREERYAALALARLKKTQSLHVMSTLPAFEELIVTGAWWDYVDEIAAHDIGAILANEPRPMRRAMLAWSKDDDIWKRRSAILCQLRFKERTDLDLLYQCIAPSLGRSEFWLRKAIGWALRQYAWTDPAETLRYVEANRTRLSGLSRREALKNIAPATSSPGRGGRRRSA